MIVAVLKNCNDDTHTTSVRMADYSCLSFPFGKQSFTGYSYRATNVHKNKNRVYQN